MDSDLSLDFLRVVEQAAIACAHTMGQGDRHKSDQVAVETMRRVLDTVPIEGTIVIGEGERDEAPMLYIGEKVGTRAKGRDGELPQVDIAVDPLQGTHLSATGPRYSLDLPAVMGCGGAPEGVLTAAAMRCLNGEIYARLVIDKPEHEARCRAMGISDFKKVYTSKDLASGKNIIFAATGVTDGALMRGVRFFGDGTRTSSLVMQSDPPRIRFIDTIHVEQTRMVRIRF